MSRFATSTATVPQPCQVLGTSLRPFCLGHHLLFKRLGLPFAGNHEADAGQDDLLIGVALCAGSSYEDTLNSLLDGSWPGVFKNWRRAVFGPWYWRRKPNLFRAEKLFRAYLKTGYEKPPLWRHPDCGGVELSSPWEQLLKCRLVDSGFSETEIFNGYLPARWYDYFSVLEIKRAEGLRTKEDKEDWRKIFYTQSDHEKIQRAKNNGGIR